MHFWIELKEQRKQRENIRKYYMYIRINWFCSVYLLMRLEFKYTSEFDARLNFCVQSAWFTLYAYSLQILRNRSINNTQCTKRTQTVTHRHTPAQHTNELIQFQRAHTDNRFECIHIRRHMCTLSILILTLNLLTYSQSFYSIIPIYTTLNTKNGIYFNFLCNLMNFYSRNLKVHEFSILFLDSLNCSFCSRRGFSVTSTRIVWLYGILWNS